jgi:hypothetical protein
MEQFRFRNPFSGLGLRIVQLSSLVALGGSLQGCVAARHYDEARSVAEAETSAHGRTRARLEAALKRIETLESDLQGKEQALAQRETDVAQSKLDTTVAQKEREAAAMLVEQLRGELARTGDHLSSSSREKRDLQQTLLIAEQRMQSIEAAGKQLELLVGATRELALGLETSLEKGGVELGAKDGQVVVSIPAEKLFAADADSLHLDALPLLAAVGKVSAAHPELRVVVREPAKAPYAAGRARNLAQALRERGVAEARLTACLPVAEPNGEMPAAEAAENEEASGAMKKAGTQPELADGAPAKPETAKAKTLPAERKPLRYEIAFAP